ncbi:MAG: hypothetical protein ABI442_07900 [Gemmatimonadaceae bacterium]
MVSNAFAERLSELPPESDEWRYHLAGSHVLLAAEELARGTSPLASTRIANDHMRRVPDLASQAILRDALLAITGQNSSAVARRLCIYGDHLHAAAHYAVAADVFDCAARLSARDPSLLLRSMLGRAFAFRMLRRLDDASQTYAALRAAGLSLRIPRLELEGILGEAKASMDRGNYPGAEGALIEVIARARESNDRELLGRALTDAARLAGVRGNPVGVVEHSFESLAYVKESRMQDRIFQNIAFAYREMGRGRVAAMVASHVERAAVDLDQRQNAQILLYNLAIDAGHREDAHVYERALERAELPPVLQAEFHEAVARDRATNGQFDQAIAAAERMAHAAEERGLTELAARAEAALSDLRRNVVPAVYRFRPTPVPRHAVRSLEGIDTALKELCGV